MKETQKSLIKKEIKTNKKTDVDSWLERETPHKRKAFENASTYFDKKDELTVSTIEAVYAQESSFGTLLRERGAKGAVGEFHIEKATAKRYKLIVTKENDQRFDIDYASITAARYLKDLDVSYSKKTDLGDKETFPIKNPIERKKFVLAAYNGGEGTIAKAQRLAKQVGKNPAKWNDVHKFLEQLDPKVDAKQIRDYVQYISKHEVEFAKKSKADKKAKDKKDFKLKVSCTQGHWITKDGHHIFICD